MAKQKITKKELHKRQYEMLPQLIGITVVFLGLYLSLTANIIHDWVKNFKDANIYALYLVIVFSMVAVFGYLLYYSVQKFYLKPFDDLEKRYKNRRK